jgi:hypothetical protein
MLRWTARILATLVTLYWLLIGVLTGLHETAPLDLESAIMALLFITSTVFVLVAWVRERLGGILLLLVGSAHCIFAWIASGHNRLLAVAISGLPYLIFGGLFLLSARSSSGSVVKARS